MVRRPRLPGPNDIRELNRRLTKAGDDLERLTRRILPVSKGGDSEGRTVLEQLEDTLRGPDVEREITGQEPIPTFTFIPGSGGSRGSRGQLLEMIANDDDIILTPELVEVINDPEMRITSDMEITRRVAPKRRPFGRDVIRDSKQFTMQGFDLPTSAPKRKRKVSKYQTEFGKQLKLLKKKHPRTSVTRLMKRAHTNTRKKLGTKKGQVRKTARRAFER